MYEIQMGGSALGKVGFGSLATLVMASAALALPQEAWTQEGDAPGMGNRYLSSIVYDSDRHEVLTILGGHASGHYSEIWSWAAATWSWSKVWDGSSDGPDDRGQAAADDDGQGNTWLVGGYQGGEQIYFDDTWRWDGTSWTEEEFDGGPTPGFRSAAVMVYDSDRDVFVLFGGWVDGVGYVDDTWELDPEEGWSQVHPGGGGCPTQRGAHGMTYDTRTKRALLYGGTDDPYNEVALDDMWAWDGSEWELLAPAEPGGPGPRTGHGMAQDPETGLIYLYGGMTHVGMNPRYADLWTWDGTMWDLVHDGITPPAPVGRSHTDIAFVEDHDEVLLYGGESHQGTVLGDTWTFDPDPEDTITYSLVSGPSNGSLPWIHSSDGSFEYTPNLNFVGSDSFEFQVSDGIATDTATITIDVYVPQVTFDLRVAEDDSHLAFQLDHYVGTDTSFDTFWVLPVPFELEVTLPDGLSPSEVQVSLWDGSVLDLTSNEQTLEFTALPPATGSILDAWAALAWTCDPTLQIPSDDHPVTIEDTLKKHTEMVREYVNLCAELGIPTVVNESILEGMQDPFAQVKDYINNDVDFSLLTPAQQTELTNFRDVELNALRLDMSQKLTDLTLEHLIHQATAKTDAAGKMKELLDDLDSIDISLAGDKTLEITSVVGFDFNETLKDALLNVDLPTVRDVLEKPHKLFTEVGLSGELYFDTESSVRVTGSVKNLNQDKTQSTYESSVEWFNVPLGLGTFTGNIRQGYTPATDTKDAAFTFGFDH